MREGRGPSFGWKGSATGRESRSRNYFRQSPARLRRRSREFRLAARAPALREQFDLFALPMQTGMLVTLVANYRHSEFVYVDETAAVRGSRHHFGDDLAWGASSPGLAWDESTALVSQSLTDEQLHALKLPALDAKPFHADPGYLIDSGSSADGAVHLLALTERNYARPKNWRLSRWQKRGTRWISSEVEMPDFQPVEPPPAPAAPERVRGAPTLVVVAAAATAWRGQVGAEVALQVRVESRGGPSRGLSVEVSGPALGDGIVSAPAVAVGGREPAIALVVHKGARARAELSECSLDAGFVAAERRKGEETTRAPDPPAIVLEVRVRAERVGQGLLSVRVGPLGAAGTAGSGMIARPFVVEAG